MIAFYFLKCNLESYKKRAPKNIGALNKLIIKLKYIYFSHTFSISSRDFPLVSGTHFHTKNSDRTLITP